MDSNKIICPQCGRHGMSYRPGTHELAVATECPCGHRFTETVLVREVLGGED